MNKAAPLQRPASRLAFEDKLVRLALFTGLLPCVLLGYFMLASDLSIYLKILLSFLLLSTVVYCAFSLRQQVVNQLHASTNLVEAMTNQDYSLRAKNHGLSGALNDFNLLLNTLANTLAEQSLLSKERQILLSKISAQIDVAIIAVDARQNIRLMNPAAERLFKRRFGELEGWPLRELGIQQVLQQPDKTPTGLTVAQRKLVVRTDTYFEHNQRHRLIFVTDIQNLLREEERQAWQKLLRVLSHEINNSLAPIASISETLSQLVATPPQAEHDQQSHQKPADHSIEQHRPTLQQGLAVITERAQSLNQFIQRYQQLARLPEPNKQCFAIANLLEQLGQLFPQLAYTNNDLQLYADQNQIQQVLVNLIKNACEAVTDNQEPQIALSVSQHARQIRIQITDNGSGIDNPDNLFVPFYTTKPQGSGIGLALSRQIISNHNGELTLENRHDNQGVIARIDLPMLEAGTRDYA